MAFALPLRPLTAGLAVLALLAAVAARPTAAEDAADGDPGPEADAAAVRLVLHNAHTGARLALTVRDGTAPDAETMAAAARLMHDHHNGTEHPIDPALVELLAAVAARVGPQDGPQDGAADGAADAPVTIRVLSGYRSPGTNAMLAMFNRHVARNSLHMRGQAIDIRIPGVPAAQVYEAALALGRGGVGYYPASGFVHLDTGPVRTWVPGGTPGTIVAGAHAGSRWSSWSAPVVPWAEVAPVVAADPGRPAAYTPPPAPSIGGMSLGAGAAPAPTLGGLGLGGGMPERSVLDAFPSGF